MSDDKIKKFKYYQLYVKNVNFMIIVYYIQV